VTHDTKQLTVIIYVKDMCMIVATDTFIEYTRSARFSVVRKRNLVQDGCDDKIAFREVLHYPGAAKHCMDTPSVSYRIVS
jgi:hypothetical protein